jgi:hypothetical protein
MRRDAALPDERVERLAGRIAIGRGDARGIADLVIGHAAGAARLRLPRLQVPLSCTIATDDAVAGNSQTDVWHHLLALNFATA